MARGCFPHRSVSYSGSARLRARRPCYTHWLPQDRSSLFFLLKQQICSNTVYFLFFQIFQTMKSLGISMEDATKVMTVSSAFRKAQTMKGGSAVAAIDELTSRLNLTDLSHKDASTRSPLTASIPSTPSTVQMTRNESVDSLQTRPSAVAKKGQRPTRAISHQQGRGRKRALAEKTPEKSNANVMLEEPKNKAAAADLQVKEKMLNAKLSKAEGKKPKSARAKSPEGLGTRGKRTAALHVEESQSNKRPRTRSETEESISTV